MSTWKRAVPIALALMVSALTRATLAQGGVYSPDGKATEQKSEISISASTVFKIDLDCGVDTEPKMRFDRQAKFSMRCVREDDTDVTVRHEGWIMPNAGHVQFKEPMSHVKAGDHIIVKVHWEHPGEAHFNGGGPWHLDTTDESKIPDPASSEGGPIGENGDLILSRGTFRCEFSSFIPRSGHAWSVKVIPGDVRDPLQGRGFDHAIVFLYAADGTLKYDLPIPPEEIVKGDDGSLTLNLSDVTMSLVAPGEHLEIEEWRVPAPGESIGTRSEIVTQPVK